MSKLSARLVLPLAFVLCAVMAALAADAPRLEIQSPKDGSTINSGAVMIKFKTDHFKVMREFWDDPAGFVEAAIDE